MADVATDKVGRLASELADQVRLVILTQGYTWQPLSPGYVAEKVKAGLDERILIATGFYVENIQAFLSRGGASGGSRWRVGFPPGMTHEPSQIDINLLAKWLEFGTVNMPPRPHWRPVWSRFVVNGRKNAEDVGTAVREEFTRRLES